MNGRIEKENAAKKSMESKLSALPEIFTAFYDWMDAREKSYTTMKNYINHVIEFMNFFTRGKRDDKFYEKVTDTNIEKYMTAIRRKNINGEEVEVSDEIRAAKWSSLNTFFKFLSQKKYNFRENGDFTIFEGENLLLIKKTEGSISTIQTKNALIRKDVNTGRIKTLQIEGQGKKDFYYSGCAEVYPQTVGQYIGLNDKNNEPIFEWDIVKFREWDKGDMCWIGVVHYKYQQFIVSGNPNKECDTPFEIAMSRFISDNIEVIGNFYDDPDILFQED